jgi:glycosyltransferase 2 family protein
VSETAPTDRSAGASRDSATSGIRRWFSPLLAIPTPAIFVAAAALAVILLWRQGALDELGGELAGVHPGIVAIILGIYATSIFVLGLRWHTLVRMAGGAPDWTASAEVFLTSVIINYAAPIGLAVPTRAALTVRDLRLSPGQSGAVVTWEAGLDIAALAAISAAWLALGGLDLVQTISVDGRALLVAVVALVLAVLVSVSLSRVAAVRARVVPFTGNLLSGPSRHPLLALLALVLTATFWGMQIGVMAGLLGIFGVAPAPSLLFGLMGLPVLIGMLSPVPGGAGVREALMAAVARLDDVPAGPVILAAVAYRLALFAVTPVVWGAVRVARTVLSKR